MTQVNIDDIRRDLPGLLRRIETGEAVVLLKAGKPFAEIKPVNSNSKKSLRPFGLCAGEFVVPEDFDDPLPESIVAEFEGR
ncbi:MAG: type II toxin-antitoxin system Phd/YefM family antitoxin [bacterium]